MFRPLPPPLQRLLWIGLSQSIGWISLGLGADPILANSRLEDVQTPVNLPRNGVATDALETHRQPPDLPPVPAAVRSTISSVNRPISQRSPQSIPPLSDPNFSDRPQPLTPIISPLPGHFAPEFTSQFTSQWIHNRPELLAASQWQTISPVQLKPWSTEAALTGLPVAQTPDADPELGRLRVRPNADPELGVLRLQPVGAADPELGILRLRRPVLPPPPPPPPSKSLFLVGRVDYFHNSNVLAADSATSDGLIRSGLTLFYAPPIGPQTYLVTSIDANMIRYTQVDQLNYDELRFRVGIAQRLSPRMSGEISWTNQQLFASQPGLREVFGGGRFFDENAFRIELSRQDPLTKSLTLNTYYQFRLSFTDEIENYNRFVNSFVGSLSYNLSPKLQLALDYQVIWTHFTQQERDDWYQQVGGRLSYTFNPRIQANVFGGASFGQSSDRRLKFDGWLFGVGLVFNVPLL